MRFHKGKRKPPNLDGETLRRCCRGALRLEALPTKHRTTLCRLKRNGCFLAALGTRGTCFHLRIRPGSGNAQSCCPLPFAGFATLRFVLELLIVEEKLFTGREYEIRPAVYALQHLVLEFHNAPFNPRAPRGPEIRTVKHGHVVPRLETRPPRLRFSLFSTLG